jgi:deoxycytidylate deaminase
MTAKPAELPLAGSVDQTVTLAERKTDELVIALVGPVGSGVTKTGETLTELLRDTFKYSVQPIKVSELIRDAASIVGVEVPPGINESERVKLLQLAGTKLRGAFDEGYLAEKCIEKIAAHRLDAGGYDDVDGKLIPKPRRQAYIIDSLKHPSEVQILQDVYDGIFWLVGVFAPEEIRRDRLKTKGASTDIDKIIEKDEEEGVDSGQKVRDTIQQSDFFLRNDGQNTDLLKDSVGRFLKIIFGTEVVTPSRDEAAMYTAAATAAGSACLSRQVGAAIYSGAGELIGTGRNDVPKALGGLYVYEDGACDNRCFKWQGKQCHNDSRKEGLYQDITLKLVEAGLLPKHSDYKSIKMALKKTDIKNLIEYSRAVHAEMEAILSVARGEKNGIVGATLYCTTFPCHSCARHIVASGISRVVYIEPYPKSLAIVLHKDAITIQDRVTNMVSFVQYEGVAPKNTLRLFEYRADRKVDGRAITVNPATASPISRSPLDGYFRREQIVVHRLETLEAKAQATDSGGKDAAAETK